MKHAIPLAVCVVLLSASAKGLAQARQPRNFTDEDVGRAIQKGIDYLWSVQKPDGSWPGSGDLNNPNSTYRFPYGPTALVAYALLEGGVPVQDPEGRMEKILGYLATHNSDKTYMLGCRCNVWLAANRQTDGKYTQHLLDDVEKLIKSTSDGSYNYDSRGDGKSRGDNSNSQFGLLGVWAGAMADAEVPKEYWHKVMRHWLNHQNADGGWQYSGFGESTATMTAGGVASLFVCFDNLFAEGFVRCNVPNDLSSIIQRGLDWFDENFERSIGPGRTHHFYYYLYSIERVGLASGYKYFGKADWYKLGTAYLLGRQGSDGRWDNHINTSFAILFLIRGRHPVLFNKLKFDGDWDNRPRDLANLTRWMSRKFEKTINWQIVNLRVPVEELHDAPILYISGSKTPKFTDEQTDKLRNFILQGGTVLSCTECGGREFREGIRKLYQRLFPDYELTLAGPEHKLYSAYFKVTPRVKFHVLSNGVRPLAIHTDQDLPMDWQVRRYASRRSAFEAAANVFMYCTGLSGLRARGTSLWPTRKDQSESATVRLTRLKHSGNFDPEPLALKRFALLMNNETQTKVELLEPMEITDLSADQVQVAVLTGVGRLSLTAPQKEALKAYTAAGGTLVIDAVGGPKSNKDRGLTGFAASAENLLKELYGTGALVATQVGLSGLPRFGHGDREGAVSSDNSGASGQDHRPAFARGHGR